MLCSKCYRKIPKGEEVKRGSGSVYWRAGYWEGGGGGSKIFCLRCAKKEEKRERKLGVVFIAVFIFVVLFIIFSTIFVIFLKER